MRETTKINKRVHRSWVLRTVRPWVDSPEPLETLRQDLRDKDWAKVGSGEYTLTGRTNSGAYDFFAREVWRSITVTQIPANLEYFVVKVVDRSRD